MYTEVNFQNSLSQWDSDLFNTVLEVKSVDNCDYCKIYLQKNLSGKSLSGWIVYIYLSPIRKKTIFFKGETSLSLKEMINSSRNRAVQKNSIGNVYNIIDENGLFIKKAQGIVGKRIRD